MPILLFEHLRQSYPPAEVRRLLASGKVMLSGAPTGDGGRLVEPEEISVNPRAPRCVPGRDLAVVWRDPQLAVVWKPPGLLSVPAPGRSGDDNVLARVGGIFGSAFAVHRLDEDTSGLMLVALREPMQQKLKALFERHEVERRYLALVAGHTPEGPLHIATHLVRDRGDGLRGSVERLPANSPLASQESVTAETTIRRLERFSAVSLIEARLRTGRTHQVRIHCAEQGYAVLGDPLYANRRQAQAAPRLALHAAVLGFKHPTTGEELRFVAPLADDLERLRRDLAGGGGAPGGEKTRRARRPAGREGGRTQRPDACAGSMAHFAHPSRHFCCLVAP